MKKFIVLAFIIFSAISTQAQNEDYNNAIGLRGGMSLGVSFKHFFTNNTAIEAIVHSRWKGFEVVGLMEHHNEFLGQNGLKWYFGYGAHVGLYDNRVLDSVNNDAVIVLGADGIVGIEFVIPNSPIAISADWKPYFNLIGYTGLYIDGGAISVRYVF
jgi:membrane-bound acyltransferase YfiQ involved in biofilm formation